MWLFALE